jgi:hypothetical protein
MSCYCGHTMQSLTDRTFWCPRCGTIKIVDSKGEQLTYEQPWIIKRAMSCSGQVSTYMLRTSGLEDCFPKPGNPGSGTLVTGKIEISKLKLPKRPIDNNIVLELKVKLAKQGQIDPIVIDRNYRIIDGLHRTVAAGELGWNEIEYVMRDV